MKKPNQHMSKDKSTKKVQQISISANNGGEGESMNYVEMELGEPQNSPLRKERLMTEEEILEEITHITRKLLPDDNKGLYTKVGPPELDLTKLILFLKKHLKPKK